jgi:hypothetical protein
MREFEKRLRALESELAKESKAGIWIDGMDNKINVGLNKAKQEKVFPNIYEAARWLEEQIDSREHACGSYSVSCILDLYKDADLLKKIIGGIIPHTEWGNYFRGDFFGPMKTTEKADLNLWLLSSAIRSFGAGDFREHFKKQVFTPMEYKIFNSFYVIYIWDKLEDSEENYNDFANLFNQVVRLPKPEGKNESV